jgi:hypothetical protein
MTFPVVKTAKSLTNHYPEFDVWSTMYIYIMISVTLQLQLIESTLEQFKKVNLLYV